MSEQTIQKKPVTVKKVLLILLAVLAAVVVILAVTVGFLWGNEIEPCCPLRRLWTGTTTTWTVPSTR